MQWKWIVLISSLFIIGAIIYLIFPKAIDKDPEIKLELQKLTPLNDGVPAGFKGPTAPPSMRGPSGPPPG